MARPLLRGLPTLTGSLAGRDLADLLAEHAKLRAAMAALRAERDALASTGQRRARDRDAEARALAMRAGAKDPGTAHEAEYGAKMADTERRLAAVGKAVTMVERDITRMLDERRDLWLADAEALAAAAHTKAVEALAAVHEAVNEDTQRRGLLSWLNGGRPTVASDDVPLVKGIGGDRFTVDQALGALDAALSRG